MDDMIDSITEMTDKQLSSLVEKLNTVLSQKQREIIIDKLRDDRYPNRHRGEETPQDVWYDPAPIPIYEWGIKFSGDTPAQGKENITVHKFIWAIDRYRRGENMSYDYLLKHMIFLLSGTALTWYLYKDFESYQVFVDELKARFLPYNHDFKTRKRVMSTMQAKNQPVTEFIDAMQTEYLTMEKPPPVEEQIYYIRQNTVSGIRSRIREQSFDNYSDFITQAKVAEGFVELLRAKKKEFQMK